MAAGLLPVVGLSAAGLVLAGGATWAAIEVGRSARHAGWAPVVAVAGLALAGLLPFAWISAFGRP